MKESLTFFLIGVIYIATLYVMVRPNSQGPQLIQNVLGTFTDLVRGVSGQTYDTNTGKWSSNA